MKKKAFTLIELLIVVAIIAILAAIAVPNFLEAQIRSKVSRSKADQRSVATALESYAVDNNHYPKSNYFSYAFAVPSQYPTPGYTEVLEKITTPIAYISSEAALTDPFVGKYYYSNSTFPQGPPNLSATDPRDVQVAALYHYMAREDYSAANVNEPDQKAKWWMLESCGPDRAYHSMSGILSNSANYPDRIWSTQYDPTNGTVSQGSVWRVGGEKTAVGSEFYDACRASQN